LYQTCVTLPPLSVAPRKGRAWRSPPTPGFFIHDVFSPRGIDMAKAIKEKDKQAKRKIKKIEILPLDPINYKILVCGVITVVLGYVALGMDPWDGFMALTVAPILLVLGYCVIIPVGIIYRRKKAEGATTAEVGQPAETVPQG
jgi:hypothetical protein